MKIDNSSIISKFKNKECNECGNNENIKVFEVAHNIIALCQNCQKELMSLLEMGN